MHIRSFSSDIPPNLTEKIDMDSLKEFNPKLYNYLNEDMSRIEEFREVITNHTPLYDPNTAVETISQA